MSEIYLVRDYPQPPAQLWRLLTDPALVSSWTSAGRGGRPVGFAPVAGTRFQYVATPTIGWNGIVECEVLEVREPSLLRYSWVGGAGDDLTTVTNTLEPHAAGTRFTWHHTGFTGLGGFLICRLLARIRAKMLDEGIPRALSALADADRAAHTQAPAGA